MFIENESFEKTLKRFSIGKLALIECAYYVCVIVDNHSIQQKNYPKQSVLIPTLKEISR